MHFKAHNYFLRTSGDAFMSSFVIAQITFSDNANTHFRLYFSQPCPEAALMISLRQ